MGQASRGCVALIGRPNVGKSTLFNRLTRSRAAIVDDEPGVTRDRHYGRVELEDGFFSLIDTGGFEPGAAEGFTALMRPQIEAALQEAEAIVFLVDGRAGLTPQDDEIAGRLRRSGKPIILAVNKLDRPEDENLAAEFFALGLGEPLAVSAEHKLGLDRLRESLAGALPQTEAEAEAEADESLLRVAVVGRPNVGKSSLINRILGQERLLVSEVPGTTRDAVDSLVRFGQKNYLFIDTAGLRRPGRIGLGVEKWSVLRALKALDRADLAVVLVDSLEGVTDGEARICGLAEERGRAVVVGFNKWDLVQEPEAAFRRLSDEFERRAKFLAFAPRVVLSARTGRNLPRLFEAIDRLAGQYNFRAATAEVNRVLEEATRRHQPPVIGRGRLKFFYATQAESRPPRFILFCNRPDQVHFSYARYLANQFREAFGLQEIPVKVVFKARSRRGDG